MKHAYIIYPKGEFAKWLDRKMRENNMTRAELANKLGLTTATILNYYHRKTYPREWVISDLASMFNISFEKLQNMLDSDWLYE